MSLDEGGEDYVVRHQDLKPAERVETEVFYPEEVYQFYDDYRKNVPWIQSCIRMTAVLFGVIGILVYTLELFIRRNQKEIKDSYERNRGLGSVYASSRRRVCSHGRGGCACACTCACAGGGRAGCSRKDLICYKLPEIQVCLNKDKMEVRP